MRGNRHACLFTGLVKSPGVGWLSGATGIKHISEAHLNVIYSVIWTNVYIIYIIRRFIHRRFSNRSFTTYP